MNRQSERRAGVRRGDVAVMVRSLETSLKYLPVEDHQNITGDAFDGVRSLAPVRYRRKSFWCSRGVNCGARPQRAEDDMT